MTDITEIFNRLIEEFRSIDIADREFFLLIDQDAEIKKLYVDWCEEQDYTLKKGFIAYCEEYLEQEESRWEVLDEEDSYYDK